MPRHAPPIDWRWPSRGTVNLSAHANLLPGAPSANTTAYIAGDDADAKRAVAELVVDLGWSGDRILDLGDLAAARAIEHYYPLFLATYRALHTLVFNVAVVTEDGRGAPRA